MKTENYSGKYKPQTTYICKRCGYEWGEELYDVEAMLCVACEAELEPLN